VVAAATQAGEAAGDPAAASTAPGITGLANFR
jgi:hypothetical protein